MYGYRLPEIAWSVSRFLIARLNFQIEPSAVNTAFVEEKLRDFGPRALTQALS